MAIVAGEGCVCLGAGEVGEGGDEGGSQSLGDGVGEAAGCVARGEDGDADVEFWDESE
jgi:hypothetical protein